MKTNQIYKNPLKKQVVVKCGVGTDSGEIFITTYPCYLVGVVEHKDGDTEVMPLAWDDQDLAHVPIWELITDNCSNSCFLEVVELKDSLREIETQQDSWLKLANVKLKKKCPQYFTNK